MFEQISARLQEVVKKLRGEARLTPQHVDGALKELRMALLEADVHFSVAKKFCAGVREKAIGEGVLESLTASQQVIKIMHDEMIHLRDKLYAHKDLNGYQVESEIFNTVRAVVIGGAITILSNELIPRGPKLQTIMEHVDRLVAHFDAKARTLLQKIRRPGWPPDGEYILNMDATSDDIFKPVSESEATALVKSMAEPGHSAEREKPRAR